MTRAATGRKAAPRTAAQVRADAAQDRCEHTAAQLAYSACRECVAAAIEVAVAEEREACAAIAEREAGELGVADHADAEQIIALEIADAIRARGASK